MISARKGGSLGIKRNGKMETETETETDLFS